MGGGIHITLLQQRVIQELQNRDVECDSAGPYVIRVFYPEKEVLVSLRNLHKAILSDPTTVEKSIEAFLSHLGPLEVSTVGSIYPRILAVEHNKSLDHPWVQSFLGPHLDIALIEHINGRMQFLSPLQVIRREGGLQLAKRQAVENIGRLLFQVQPVKLSPTIWRICHPEVLTSSLVLCIDKMLDFHSHRHAIQFAIPSRGTLYLSKGDLRPADVLIQQDYQRDPYPITPDIFQSTVSMIQRFRHSWEGQ